MSRRVGRPYKPFEQIRYSEDELNLILTAIKKLPCVDLITKVKKDLKERKRLHKAYLKTKERMFGKNNK